jgi:hypothetical protein
MVGWSVQHLDHTICHLGLWACMLDHLPFIYTEIQKFMFDPYHDIVQNDISWCTKTRKFNKKENMGHYSVHTHVSHPKRFKNIVERTNGQELEEDCENKSWCNKGHNIQ